MNEDAAHFRTLCRVVGGFFIILVIAFCVMIYVLTAILNDLIEFLGKELTIYNFQDLISGILALFVGLLTVWFIWKQIKQTERQIEQTERERLDRLSRKAKATRATMPFALSLICEYSEDYLSYASMLRQNATTLDRTATLGRDEQQVQELTDAARRINLSTSTLDLLVQCVEYADEEWSNIIAGLLSELQVVEARLDDDKRGGLRHRPQLSRVADTRARDASKIYGMATHLFPYARNEVDKPSDLEPIDRGQLFRLRRDLGFDLEASESATPLW